MTRGERRAPAPSRLSFRRGLSRRDLAVAAAAALCTLGAVEIVHSEPAPPAVLGSSIYDWTTFEARTTKTGAYRQVLQAPTATLDELELHVTTLNPGEAPHPPHKHADEELIIVKEGTVEALVAGQKKRVGPGSVILQASNQMHAIRNVGTTPATYHVIKWNSPGMLRPKAKP